VRSERSRRYWSRSWRFSAK